MGFPISPEIKESFNGLLVTLMLIEKRFSFMNMRVQLAWLQLSEMQK
jgi:hypothetical protein